MKDMNSVQVLNYNKHIVKIVGVGEEYTFANDKSVYVGDFKITKIVAEGEYAAELYNGDHHYDASVVGVDVLCEVFTTLRDIKENLLEEILETQRTLLGLEGYQIKYYNKEAWRTSFATESLHRLENDSKAYKEQVARRTEKK